MDEYSRELIAEIQQEALSTSALSQLLLPLFHEITKNGCYDRELLAKKLLLEARIFNRVINNN